MKSKRRKKRASKEFDDDILFDLDYDSVFRIEDYDLEPVSLDTNLDDYFDSVSLDTELEDLLLDYDFDISDPSDAAAQAADTASGDSES